MLCNKEMIGRAIVYGDLEDIKISIMELWTLARSFPGRMLKVNWLLLPDYDKVWEKRDKIEE